jgi:hypothetical protein
MATQNIYALVDTWNAGGTTFTGIGLNVTDTASAAGSMLIDLQVGGASQFKVTKAGAATITTIELGNATDTTLSRVSAGVVAIEGVEVTTNSGTQSLSNKTLSSPTLSGTVAGTFQFSGSIGIGVSPSYPLDVQTGVGRIQTRTLGSSNGIASVNTANTVFFALAIDAASVDFNSNSGGTLTKGGVAVPTISSTDTLSNKTLSGVTIADATNIILNTTTGTKIGTATSQKLGFFNQTPVVQPTAVADATDAASVITQLNALLTRMRNLGLIAT